MTPLRELPDTRQIEGEPRRRWFHSTELDLVVWVGEDDTPTGFQLCYDKMRGEHALTWRAASGFDHAAVDDGESRPDRYKSSPILVADGNFDWRRVRDKFLEASADMPEPLRAFVSDVLARYPRG